jgi:hypothetical protein
MLGDTIGQNVLVLSNIARLKVSCQIAVTTKNYSVPVLITTSTVFSVPDEEGYPKISQPVRR